MSIQKKLSGSGFAPLQVTNIIGDNDPGETALGSTSGTAYGISACNTFFTTVASGTGAILPPGNTGGANTNSLGDEYMIANLGANALTVYPPPGGTINGAASVSISANSLGYFTCCSTNGLTWISK
jgi:hypothetical protein